MDHSYDNPEIILGFRLKYDQISLFGVILDVRSRVSLVRNNK